MATYYEFKQMVSKIFRHGAIEDNYDDITINLSNRYHISEESSPSSFVISDTELQDLYNRVNSIPCENLELFISDSYEIAVDMDYPYRRGEEYPIVSKDDINGIQYTLGFPSIEYCAFLIMNIIDIKNKEVDSHLLLPAKFTYPFDFFLRHFRSEGEPYTLQSLLPKMMRILSLKIETTSPTSIIKFRSYKTSFVFQLMYRSGLALIEYPNIYDMFQLNRPSRERVDFTQLDTPPLREYAGDVVDYYKMALSTSDPYIKFISFYHVMEYFYDEIFKKKLVADLKEQITDPGFSYKNDDKIYNIALFVKNRLKMNDESGQGNELESLKFVLREYVSVSELKNRISQVDSTALQHYQTYKVTFCNAPTIPWSDEQGVYTHIAKRIYFVRNSLVHSKSGKNQERYKPYKDESQLQKEILLVKTIAELIIINSSSII